MPGTIAGLLYLAGELEKITHAFGLVNVTLFAIIFFQIQLYASLLLQLFFCRQRLRLVCMVATAATMRLSCRSAGRRAKRWAGWRPAVAIGLLTLFINPFFAFLTRIAVSLMQALGLQVTMPERSRMLSRSGTPA